MTRTAPSRAAPKPLAGSLFFTVYTDPAEKDLQSPCPVSAPPDRLWMGGTALLSSEPSFRRSWFGICTCRDIVRGAVSAPGGFRNLTRNGVIGAGWRRASRLTGHTTLLDAPRPEVAPLLQGIGVEPPALESLDSSAPSDHPPSNPDSPATTHFRPGLSASDPSLCCLAFSLTVAHACAATSGCEALPNGLTR
jgi:hypothetical protein